MVLSVVCVHDYWNYRDIGLSDLSYVALDKEEEAMSIAETPRILSAPELYTLKIHYTPGCGAGGRAITDVQSLLSTIDHYKALSTPRAAVVVDTDDTSTCSPEKFAAGFFEIMGMFPRDVARDTLADNIRGRDSAIRALALAEAAKSIDCGGIHGHCKPTLWRDECVRKTSSECWHDLAQDIRALVSP